MEYSTATNAVGDQLTANNAAGDQSIPTAYNPIRNRKWTPTAYNTARDQQSLQTANSAVMEYPTPMNAVGDQPTVNNAA